MELKKISLKDKELFKDVEYISSDYVFSCIYMYSELYKLKIYHDDRTIIIWTDADNPTFYMPLGDTEYGIRLVLQYCREHQTKPHFIKIPYSHVEIFKAMNYIIMEDRNAFDYIFSNLELAAYKGPSFRKQRNNISNYTKINQPAYSGDIIANMEKCKEFTLKYYSGTDVVQPTLKIL
ncbi:MAG: phosphatidylglycerol lysyltransferase domain-containing protein, partial [Pseudomonadota bacterium]